MSHQPVGSESNYGGTRVDEMLPPEALERLISGLTSDPRTNLRARRERVLRGIPADLLESELARREAVEYAGE